MTSFTVTITSVGNQILIRYTFVVKFSKMPANLQVSVFQYSSTFNFLIPGTNKLLLPPKISVKLVFLEMILQM
jgi:hypothetical protein